MTNLAAAVELKACPFCGLDVTDDEGCFPINREKTRFEVRCGNPSCYAHEPSDESHAAAIARWNQRPPVAGLADSQIMELWQAMNNASKFFCANNKVPINEWAASHERAVLKAAREFLGKVE